MNNDEMRAAVVAVLRFLDIDFYVMFVKRGNVHVQFENKESFEKAQSVAARVSSVLPVNCYFIPFCKE